VIPVFCLPQPVACAPCRVWRPTETCRLAARAAAWRLAPLAMTLLRNRRVRVTPFPETFSGLARTIMPRPIGRVCGAVRVFHRPSTEMRIDAKNGSTGGPAGSSARRAGAAARCRAPAGRPVPASECRRTPNRASGRRAPDRQGDGGHEERRRQAGGRPRENIRGAPAGKHGTAARAAATTADTQRPALGALQQHGADQRQRNQQMDDEYDGAHEPDLKTN
jgi:hypothetical protein